MQRDLRYCTTADGVTIAYTVSGHGDRVFVHTPNAISASIQLEPLRGAWLDALGERFTVVQFDSRGTGLSQRACDELSNDGVVLDLEAVMNEIDASAAILFGYLGGAYAASAYAVAHPAQVSRLLLWPPPLIEWGDADRTPLGQLAVTNWETFTEVFAHEALGWAQGEQAHTYARLMRETVSQQTFLRYFAGLLGTTTHAYWAHARDIAVPTLVFQRKTYTEYSFVAGPIRGAAIRMVDGESIGPFIDHMQDVLDVIFEFTGAAPLPSSDRAPSPATRTAVLIFTDIADSTALTERIGDEAFRSASRTLDERIRATILESGGSVVEGKVLGDGVMGIFASAAQAITAARGCVRVSGELPLHIGLHAGDVIREDGNVYGGAVNIASRICGLCAPGEILVSQTVRDLARTSAGGAFEDRGEHMLKGIEDPVRVFAVDQG